MFKNEKKQVFDYEEAQTIDPNATEKPVNNPEENAENTAQPAEEETVPAEEESASCDGKGSKKELKETKKALAEAQRQAESLAKELEDAKDQYLRMMAEYDNFRKRAQKEKEGIYADAYADALKELLVVKDNLELAVQYADKDSFQAGVVMTLNKFTETLTKLGVEEFGAPGDPFDPNIHNAVMHGEDETAGENVLGDVLQKGYRKGDKILRYAMVKVLN